MEEAVHATEVGAVAEPGEVVVEHHQAVVVARNRSVVLEWHRRNLAAASMAFDRLELEPCRSHSLEHSCRTAAVEVQRLLVDSMLEQHSAEQVACRSRIVAGSHSCQNW